jgi:hypothetical protein
MGRRGKRGLARFGSVSGSVTVFAALCFAMPARADLSDVGPARPAERAGAGVPARAFTGSVNDRPTEAEAIQAAKNDALAQAAQSLGVSVQSKVAVTATLATSTTAAGAAGGETYYINDASEVAAAKVDIRQFEFGPPEVKPHDGPNGARLFDAKIAVRVPEAELSRLKLVLADETLLETHCPGDSACGAGFVSRARSLAVGQGLKLAGKATQPIAKRLKVTCILDREIDRSGEFFAFAVALWELSDETENGRLLDTRRAGPEKAGAYSAVTAREKACEQALAKVR